MGAPGDGGGVYIFNQELSSLSGESTAVGSSDHVFDSNFNDLGLGWKMAPVGDHNGDGIDDVLITAMGAYASGDTGVVYIVDGACLDGSVGNIDSAALLKINAESAGDAFGRSVAVGDLDGDGITDFAIGAPYFMPDPNMGLSGAEGRVYIWLSSSN